MLFTTYFALCCRVLELVQQLGEDNKERKEEKDPSKDTLLAEGHVLPVAGLREGANSGTSEKDQDQKDQAKGKDKEKEKDTLKVGYMALSNNNSLKVLLEMKFLKLKCRR